MLSEQQCYEVADQISNGACNLRPIVAELLEVIDSLRELKINEYNHPAVIVIIDQINNITNAARLGVAEEAFSKLCDKTWKVLNQVG
jgi:hypothetical protein